MPVLIATVLGLLSGVVSFALGCPGLLALGIGVGVFVLALLGVALVLIVGEL